MSVLKALDLYHGKDNYNCAQAIRLAFAKENDEKDALVKEYKLYGHGKAPQNTCGAVYAGMKLTNELDYEAGFASTFKQETGYIKCSDLKVTGKVSCEECVKIAAQILEERVLLK